MRNWLKDNWLPLVIMALATWFAIARLVSAAAGMAAYLQHDELLTAIEASV